MTTRSRASRSTAGSSVARHGIEAGGGDRRLDLRPLGARASGATSRSSCSTHVQAMGQAGGGGADAGRASRRADRRPVDRAAGHPRELRRGHAAGRLPGRRPLVLPEHVGALGDDRRRPADPLRLGVSAPGGYDTHDNQAEHVRRRHRHHLRHARRLPGRPGGSRPGRPRHHPRVLGVRPPPRAERDPGTDHGAAGAAFVMGTQVQGEMVGEWPGLGDARRGRQPAPHRPTSARSTARSSSSGSTSTRPADPRRLGLLAPADHRS